MARISRTILNKSVKSRHDPSLRKKSIQSLGIKYTICYRLFTDILYQVTEKAMAPHSSTLAWKIPWAEEPGRLHSMVSLWVWLHFHFSLSCLGEGNGNPLQCSCLENPRDGRAWWTAIYGVTRSQTWMKWLSSSLSSEAIPFYSCLAESVYHEWVLNLMILFCLYQLMESCDFSYWAILPCIAGINSTWL